MAAHRDPVTVRGSVLLKAQFLKGSVEVLRTIIFEDNKNVTLEAHNLSLQYFISYGRKDNLLFFLNQI